MNITGKQVLITGASGFLGKTLVEKVKKLKPKSLITPSHKDFDLREKDVCISITKDIDTVIHLAANVGGIGYNQAYPGTLFYDNLLMGVQLMEASRLNNVKKFVALGTICAYPKYTPVPFMEEDLWNGYPEETNAPYGLAKKMLLVQSQAYREEYGFNSIYLLPVNFYGPNDNFDPKSSHVIAALIKKFVEAKANGGSVTVWGTGKATREFLYIDDAADAIVLATEKYNRSEPVNIGSGFEISIKDLAYKIAEFVEFKGDIIFDTSKPDGQPRRKLDISKAEKAFGFKAKTNFDEGLKKTINWYIQSQKKK
jgi:GDP-L-fucose synthase